MTHSTPEPTGAQRPPGTGYPQPGTPQAAQPQHEWAHHAPAVPQVVRPGAPLGQVVRPGETIAQPVAQYRGSPVQAGWTSQAWNSQVQRRPAGDPTKDGADLARLIIGVSAVGLLGIGLLVILLIAGLSLHGLGTVVVFLSAIPLAVIITMVWWFDRWKSRPKLLLALCVLWGAVAAVVGVLIFQTLGIGIAGAIGVDLTGQTVGAVVMAPLFEESFKGVFLVAIVLGARKYFEGPLDGWVYGSLIGAGFAFTENLLYLGKSFADGSAAGLAVTFLMRCLMSPLLHSTFVMCAGVFIGWAARRGQWWLTAIMWIPGMVCGMVFHGLWNGSMALSQRLHNGLIVLGVMVLVSVLISALWFGLGLFLRSDEAKHTRHALSDYATAGWLTHEEVTMLGTWGGRRAGKSWARQYPGGIEHMKAMNRLATELAGIRVRLLAGVTGAKEQAAEQAKLRQFTAERRALMTCASRAQHGWAALPGPSQAGVPTGPPRPRPSGSDQGWGTQAGGSPPMPARPQQAPFSARPVVPAAPPAPPYEPSY